MRKANGLSESELRRILWGVQLGSQDEFAAGQCGDWAFKSIGARRLRWKSMSSVEFHTNSNETVLGWLVTRGQERQPNSVVNRDQSESHRNSSILAFSGFNG
ncbi:MAG: hypothetical protein DWH81_11250 [Planctomycetota bacterium]|nr:MAG: hypothetical protein DWH81_11250 [Planctomycetota bacterium]